MSDTIHVGTRKGLVTVSRRDGTWTVDRLSLENVAVTELLHLGDGTIVAGLHHGHYGPKIGVSPDGGATFTDVALPAHPEPASDEAPDVDPNRREPLPDATQLIWALAATSDGTWWCGTMPGALFSSTDRGATWDLNRALWDHPIRKEWFGGGNDFPVINVITPDPRGPERLAVAVSCGGVWRTTDGGASWELGTGMRAPFMPPERAEDPAIQDVHYLARCAGAPDVLWAQHHSGIYRSTDDARTWVEITEAGPSTFGFPVAAHPTDPDTAWFVPAQADEWRLPVDGKVVVTRTRDGGASFDVLSEGLPPAPAWDLVHRHGLAIDQTGERLAFGSTTGSLWVSEDAGDTWTHVSAHLPPVHVVRFA